jgi:hypothetical protein
VTGALAAAVAGVAFAQAPGQQLRDSAADTIDFEERRLGELPLQLPAAPKGAELLEFDSGRRTTLRFFVDPASLTVGADGIVRFTVVIRGEGAASNVSYEAIRCKTRERKVYAYGRPTAPGTRCAIRSGRRSAGPRPRGIASRSIRTTSAPLARASARRAKASKRSAAAGIRGPPTC